jgi:hypothetical protein
MAKPMKHIGKLKNTGAKVLVAFRTVPGESNQALVIHAAQLPDQYHDAIMKLVEEDQAQQAFELGEILFIRKFPDGRSMLQALQQDNRLRKVPTDTIMMNPTPTTEIVLSELNQLIAEQKNVSVDDLYTLVKGAPAAGSKVEDVATVTETPAPVAQAPADGALSDEDLAKSLRSQADAMFKEAQRLRKEAEELVPTKKKATKKKEVEA